MRLRFNKDDVLRVLASRGQQSDIYVWLEEIGVDPDIVIAILIKESNLNNPASRFQGSESAGYGAFQGFRSWDWPSVSSQAWRDHTPMLREMIKRYANGSVKAFNQTPIELLYIVHRTSYPLRYLKALEQSQCRFVKPTTLRTGRCTVYDMTDTSEVTLRNQQRVLVTDLLAVIQPILDGADAMGISYQLSGTLAMSGYSPQGQFAIQELNTFDFRPAMYDLRRRDVSEAELKARLEQAGVEEYAVLSEPLLERSYRWLANRSLDLVPDAKGQLQSVLLTNDDDKAAWAKFAAAGPLPTPLRVVQQPTAASIAALYGAIRIRDGSLDLVLDQWTKKALDLAAADPVKKRMVVQRFIEYAMLAVDAPYDLDERGRRLIPSTTVVTELLFAKGSRNHLAVYYALLYVFDRSSTGRKQTAVTALSMTTDSLTGAYLPSFDGVPWPAAVVNLPPVTVVTAPGTLALAGGSVLSYLVREATKEMLRFIESDTLGARQQAIELSREAVRSTRQLAQDRPRKDAQSKT